MPRRNRAPGDRRGFDGSSDRLRAAEEGGGIAKQLAFQVGRNILSALGDHGILQGSKSAVVGGELGLVGITGQRLELGLLSCFEPKEGTVSAQIGESFLRLR